MDLYVSRDTISSCIEFFREKDYKKPEQIGLFFYFKAAGLNAHLYSTYHKWGETPDSDRRAYLRNLYNLAANFNAATETGLKRTALFPFSISRNYSPNMFYNGATIFSGLGSRISDTLDNALVSTIIQRNNANPSEIKFADGYVQLLAEHYMNGHKISLEYLSAWFYKFWKISMPENATSRDFQDVCVLGFLKHFHISPDEFQNLFFYGRGKIASGNTHITGEELRTLLRFNDKCAPEIREEPTRDYMAFSAEMSVERVSQLLALRGDALTNERILEILSEEDQALQAQAAALIEATYIDNAGVHDYIREELNDEIESDNPEERNKRNFRAWMETQVKPEGDSDAGQPYTANSINQYVSNISNTPLPSHEGHSVFYTDSVIEVQDCLVELEASDKKNNTQISAVKKYLMYVMESQEVNKPLNYNTGLKTEYERNRIVFGAPGTGKSFTLNSDRKKLLYGDREVNEENIDRSLYGEYERVTFHPDYSYANFVGTYKPVPCKDSDGKDAITYSYVPGPFMRTYVKALKNSRTDAPKPFLLVIEEINRANVAAVFGDVFQLLDRGDDGVSEYPIQASEDIKKYLARELGGNPNDYSEIRIPNNMFIWATMNSADQGVLPMDTAFKRRWDFTYLGIDDSEAGIVGKKVILGQGDYRRTVEWNALRKAINNELLTYKVNEDKLMGPYFISKKNLPEGEMIDSAKFSRIFKNKVIMYLFDDAARQKRITLFGGCDETAKNQYSKICREFDKKGVCIFCEGISSQFIDNVPEDDGE